MTQHRMTREAFEIWARRVEITVRPPYDVVPCPCADVNCHGWRFVERRAAEVRDLVYDPVGAGA